MKPLVNTLLRICCVSLILSRLGQYSKNPEITQDFRRLINFPLLTVCTISTISQQIM